MQDNTRISLSGNRLIWTDWRNGKWTYSSSYNADIYLYDLETGKEYNVTYDSRKDQESGDVYGDYVVWTDLRHGYHDMTGWYVNSEIYLRRVRGGIWPQWRLTNTPERNEYWPQIYKNYIIWYASYPNQDYRFDKHVYLYDFSELVGE
ncbi:MAG: hypothetical protein GXP49_09565 [Deltaproteobacteria bacterium]|nr:hypothetical protein [Deltaproteobacteria bacterium]